MHLDSYTLDVKLQQCFTAECYQALLLCIILHDPEYLKWYHNNLVNIYLDLNCIEESGKGGQFGLGFLDAKNLFQQVLHIQRTFTVAERILETITGSISEGYYVILSLDSFYLPFTKSFGQGHFSYPYLIYGYDHNPRKLFAIGFDSSEIFSRLTISYDDLMMAYDQQSKYPERTPTVFASRIDLVRRRAHLARPQFNDILFFSQLANYLTPAQTKNRLREGLDSVSSIIPDLRLSATSSATGIQAYVALAQSLQRVSKKSLVIDYPYIHFAYEHRLKIFNGLHYTSLYLQAHPDIGGLTDNYQIILNKLKIARFKFFKYQRTEDLQALTYVTNALYNSIEIETEILTKVLVIAEDCGPCL